MAVATVAGLEARAGGGEGSAPILLAGYDPVLVTLGSGRRVNSGAQGKHRDGPPSQPAGMGSDALVREGNGGEIASSVPTEARVQNGHSGTWIARSVPAEIRARAQSAYEQAYTRAYRAYLGASPAAGDPLASPLSGAGYDPRCGSPGPCQISCGGTVSDLLPPEPPPGAPSCSIGCKCVVFFWVESVYQGEFSTNEWVPASNCGCYQCDPLDENFRHCCDCRTPVYEKRSNTVQRSRKFCVGATSEIYMCPVVIASATRRTVWKCSLTETAGRCPAEAYLTCCDGAPTGMTDIVLECENAGSCMTYYISKGLLNLCLNAGTCPQE